MEDVDKVVLPHVHPINQQQRIATRATVRVGQLPVLAYSVHTETFAATAGQRQDQVDALVKDIGVDAPLVVVGGDFNTGSPCSQQYLDNSMESIGLTRATKGIGGTAQYGPVELQLDHIYTRGFRVLDAGKVEGATASDHLPIWTLLRAAP
jgi:endonuclease/exonuclease/phosphatase family metal-dependent hydrolase